MLAIKKAFLPPSLNYWGIAQTPAASQLPLLNGNEFMLELTTSLLIWNIIVTIGFIKKLYQESNCKSTSKISPFYSFLAG